MQICRNCEILLLLSAYEVSESRYKSHHESRCPDCLKAVRAANQQRRAAAPVQRPRVKLVDGRVVCERCGCTRYYPGESGERYCMDCGEYLNPPPIKLPSAFAVRALRGVGLDAFRRDRLCFRLRRLQPIVLRLRAG